MKHLDILVVFVVLLSLFLFSRSSPRNTGGPTALKLYEGERITNGKQGMAELGFKNILDTDVTCNITVTVYQLWSVKYEDSSLLTFPPDESLTNISIFIPDGRNKVIVRADC